MNIRMEHLFRIISWFLAVPFFVCLFIWGDGLLAYTFVFIGGGALYEYGWIVGAEDKALRILMFFLGLLVCILGFFAVSAPQVWLIFSLVFMVFGVYLLACPQRNAHSFERGAALLLGVPYIAGALICGYWLYYLSLPSYPHIGKGLFLLCFGVSWANDSAAYLGGYFFGKHLLLPRVSPKKTWEGFIAGSIVGIIAPLLFKYVLDKLHLSAYFSVSWSDIWWIAVPAVVLAPIGDLVESRIKRCYQAKDSGTFLPGHGGILDRIDSVLFLLPWTLLYVLWIRPTI